jgi:glucosyl-3-phosphoglycerate synthase
VTAIPRLVARDSAVMERRLEQLARRSPVALVIPMIPAELDRPALAAIVEELRQVRYLDCLVISLNHASPDDYQRALAYFEPYQGRKVLLWNESPAVEAVVAEMAAAGLYTGYSGKGRACWLAIGHVLAEERASYIAFQDADVCSFSRSMLAYLVLPALEPSIDFDFVKAYYARVSDRLHGRVTRLLLTPLLAAFTRLIGQDPHIRYLSSFRYALSGEFVMKTDLAERMRLPCDWGLEIVTLFEALRHRAPGRIGQVEIAERYEHKHQDLSPDDPKQGLNRMARDVVKHLLRTLAAAGVNLSPGLMLSLQAAYQREAERAPTPRSSCSSGRSRSSRSGSASASCSSPSRSCSAASSSRSRSPSVSRVASSHARRSRACCARAAAVRTTACGTSEPDPRKLSG